MTARAPTPGLAARPRRDEVIAAIAGCRSAFVGIGVFSACVNLLGLTGSLYMMQISDRVLSSRNLATLVGLSLVALAAYLLLGVLDALRCRMLARVGAKVNDALMARVYALTTTLALKGLRPAIMTQSVRDVDQLQRVLAGSGPTAFFDLPFMPIFLTVAFLMHPLLGWLVVFGAIVIIALAALTEMRMRGPTMAATISAAARHVIVDASFRNAEVVKAMGMTPAFASTFASVSARCAGHNLESSDASSGIRSMAKVFRAVLQSAVLGLGAWLAIIGELSPGAMIAASILTARALAPIEVAVANWQGFLNARQSFERLRRLLAEHQTPEDRLPLPEPRLGLSVEGIYVTAPGQDRPIVSNVSFELEAGQGLAIIGPSASGKSTLARALIGVWPAARGRVAFDDAPIDQWDGARLGRHIGYLPQDIGLFDGSVAENIARFDSEADARDIIAAARAAGSHEMILRLPQGYETRIGDGGAALSAGQRQRVGLARALYGAPFLVVLDEPNSNLDSEGEDALANALVSVRRRGGIVVVVTHRPTALAGLDKVAVMIDGRLQAFGDRDTIMRRVTPGQRPAAPRQQESTCGQGSTCGGDDGSSRGSVEQPTVAAT